MSAVEAGLFDAAVTEGRAATPIDARVRYARAASTAALIASMWTWHVRTTGGVSWQALALLAALVLTCLAYGAWFARVASGLVSWQAGIAYEAVVGFLIANTLLFVLTFASPLGIGPNALLVAMVPLVGRAARGLRPDALFRPGPARVLSAEVGSLVCIVFTGLAATLWVGDQQPLLGFHDDRAVFTVWNDVFIHVREISAFAQAHGLKTIPDIKLAGVQALPYHYASYMMPAALNALTGTSAFDAYGGLQLPLGLLLTGLAAYVMASVLLRTVWPAVFGSALLVALPDAYHQGVDIRYLSFHFMTQVNLGMLYGLACIAMAWVFMIEGCRRGRLAAVVVAYVLLATCVTYKAHLFVTNALILMLYPCAFFGSFRRRWRIGAAVVLTALFVAVVTIAETSPRVPILHLDGSGIGRYIEILTGGFAPGAPRDLFVGLYYHHHFGRLVDAALAALLIVLGSFGLWTIVAPPVLWMNRRVIERRVLWFVAIVFVNYMVMSLGLSLDTRRIGSEEEFLNRPQAWAYFVVVTLVAAAASMRVLHRRLPSVGARWMGLPVACLLLAAVAVQARGLQTFPEWEGYDTFAAFNAAPACLVRAAQYVRDHGRQSDLLQDSRFDPNLVTSATAERQAYVSDGTFGGNVDVVRERVGAVKAVAATGDATALEAWARERHVGWYLMHPEDGVGWSARDLDRAAYRCGDYRVFRLVE